MYVLCVFAHFCAVLHGFSCFRVFLVVFVLSGRSWALVGHSWAFLGRSWALLGRSRALLGRSWGALERLLGALGDDFCVNVRSSRIFHGFLIDFWSILEYFLRDFKGFLQAKRVALARLSS